MAYCRFNEHESLQTLLGTPGDEYLVNMEHDARMSCFARVPKKLFVIRPSRKGNKLKAREDIDDYASGE